MKRWERLEAWLYEEDKQGGTFTAVEYAGDQGFPAVREATTDIQAYLDAQRIQPYKYGRTKKIREGSQTLYVIHRVPGTRTRTAVWAVGVRTKDAMDVGRGLHDDLRLRVRRAFMPDLVRIKTLNPRAARKAEQQIDMVVEHALAFLEMAATGNLPDDEDEA